jgi:hypothetical protein
LNTVTDNWAFHSDSAKCSSCPTYDATGTPNRKPTLDFARGNLLQTVGSSLDFKQPYTLFAVAKNTTSGMFGAVINATTGATLRPYLGRTSGANGALFQAADPDGAVSCASCAMDGVFYSLAGGATDSTHSQLFVNGSQIGPNAVTVSNITSALYLGNISSFTGSIAEWGAVLGSGVSSAVASSIGSGQRRFYGH